MRGASILEGLRQIIETFVAGYATLNRRLWVLAVPIGLDLFLWLGPWISPQQLIVALSSLSAGMPRVDAQQVALTAQTLQEWGEHINLLSILSAPIVPVLIPSLSAPAPPGGHAQVHWAPAAGWVLLLVPLVGFALSLLLWTLYLLPVADLVRGSGERGIAMLRRVPTVWWRMVRLLGMALLAGLVVLALATVIVAVGAATSPALALLLLYLGGALVLWGVLFLYFSPSAVLISGVDPWRAVFYSMQVVRFDLWSSLGFVVLTFLIRAGMISLWQRLAGHPLGVLAGVLANAYVVSGLVTAGLLFYRDRLRRWLASEQDGQRPQTVL